MQEKSKLTLVHIFILNQVAMTLILLLGISVYGTHLFVSEQRAVKERMEPALSKEVDRLNGDLFSLEANVQKLKSMVELFEVMPPQLRVEKFRSFASTTIAPYAHQYNAYFALAPNLAQKFFQKSAYVYVVHRDYSAQPTHGMRDSGTFLSQVFLDPLYYKNQDKDLQWWWMNEGNTGVNFSDFYFDKSYMEKVMFSTTVGIYRQDRLEAVVGIDTLTSDIAERLGSFRLGSTGGVIIVDEHGRPVTPLIAQDLPLIGFKYSRATSREEFNGIKDMSQKVFSVQGQRLQDFPGADGKSYLTYAKPIKGRPWHMVVYQEKSEAYSGFYFRLLFFILVGLIVYVLLTTMVWLTGRYVMNRDRQALVELRKSRDKAEAATKSKSLFLSTMSHEIRTPLNAILGSSELLEETQLSQEQRQLLGSLRSAGDTLLGMLNNVLDFSKFEFGRMQLEQREFLLSDLVREIETLFMPLATRKGLKFILRGPDLDRSVIGDSLRLKQVLINLLGNAVKFTERGSIELNIQPQPSDECDKEFFYFEVKDTGIGIAQENINKIFDEFDQEDSSVTRRFGGTGLGLSISKKIVEMMSGELKCESQQFIGSRFYFSVKMISRRGASWPVTEGASSFLEMEAAAFNQRMTLQNSSHRILIVDDMEENHVLLKAYIKKWDYVQVDSAYTGYECLEFWEKQTYDLIFMDVQMPRISGLDTIRKLRYLEESLQRARTPVVVISANSFLEDIDKSLRAGADEHCGKPIRKKVVVELVEKYCSVCALSL